MRRLHRSVRTLSLLALIGIAPVWATNGMNMEGYGPIASGMGGASLAYENGTAALMNNPATLALIAPGQRRLDLAFGRLGPEVFANVSTPLGVLKAKSHGDSYVMPAIGFITKGERITYGAGIFAQGGMGTEFSRTSWLSDPSQGANTSLAQGLHNRSEVSVGRFLVPVAYDVNENLRIGVTGDLVWAGLDLQLAMSQAQFVDLATTQNGGSVGGSLAQVFGALYEPFGGTGIRQLHHAYFDFSDDSSMTGEAKGTGFGAKIGAVYSITPELQVGATYHTKTAISDLESDDATMEIAVNVDTGLLQTGVPSGQYADLAIPVSGKITIVDFQWPATMGIGLAYQATPRLFVAADVRQIQWSGVMEDFSMVFDAAGSAENGGFASQSLEATLFQHWDDQNVISLGAAFEATQDLIVRAGINQASNPVPDTYLNALFPAIVESHVSLGATYGVGNGNSINLSLVRGLEGKGTNPGNGLTVPAVTSTHAQWNLQVMYSHWL